jgi:hypothetical protein
MTAKEVIDRGVPGWYWWRLEPGWRWRPVEVVIRNGEWRAAGELMDCKENPKLNKRGTYLGPLVIPDIEEKL